MIDYPITIIGGGHAGIESALTSARLKVPTLLIAINLDTVGWTPCNPAIGGPGKAQLVKEIDALGGEMALLTDKTFTQIRMLNTSRGPAVRSLRSQIDRILYHREAKNALERTPQLSLIQGEVVDIARVKKGRKKPLFKVTLRDGRNYLTQAVVLATGTYLKGVGRISSYSYPSGRGMEPPANYLSNSLVKLGLKIRRFNTGTTPRIDGRTIDREEMSLQPGEAGLKFSPLTPPITREQLPSYLTYTTLETHQVVREHLHLTASRSTDMVKVGPRYCPSIEEKMVWFPEKERHPVFLEPEGFTTVEHYVQGMNISLPAEIQLKILRTVPGMNRVEIIRPGYAIDYDLLDSLQLQSQLMVKNIPGLFTAGQINGTTGYEEAACQGIITGINSALYVMGEEGFTLKRDEAYIGVLVDDLTTKGVEEPYRMLTSRVEYRLSLRQDNADLRLTPLGRKLGLVSDERYEQYVKKVREIEEIIAFLKGKRKRENSLYDYLKRPEVSIGESSYSPAGIKERDILTNSFPELRRYTSEALEEVNTRVKYEGYITRENKRMVDFREMENFLIPDLSEDLIIPGLSSLGASMLKSRKPKSIGEFLRMPGVSPQDGLVLLDKIRKVKAVSNKRL
ncbi:MAG: tRNA uridine 5-carboxymethylaminomethyl modification enzyme MnmG [candidate division WS2 bacterium]|nr:tRNA uridine 5-carboxymethylaminomethyl modification enzyme MnmG [Candidatus Psychracetigena formicireducens]